MDLSIRTNHKGARDYYNGMLMRLGRIDGQILTAPPEKQDDLIAERSLHLDKMAKFQAALQ